MKEYELLEILAALTTEYKIQPQRETAYRFALEDEDYDLISEATKRWIKTQKWPPQSSELINLAREISDQQIQSGLEKIRNPDYEYEPRDFERMLRMEKLAAEMGINLHPNELKRLKLAHAWKAEQERGIA